MKASTHDPHDQLGLSPPSAWDDHGSIAAMLALGMVCLGVSLADVPGQPVAAPSEPGRGMVRSIALNP